MPSGRTTSSTEAAKARIRKALLKRQEQSLQEIAEKISLRTGEPVTFRSLTGPIGQLVEEGEALRTERRMVVVDGERVRRPATYRKAA